MNKKRILLTGSNGYIGNALLSRLMAEDYFVVAVDNASRHAWVQEVGGRSLTHYKPFAFLNFNLNDFNDVAKAVFYSQPEVIIHLASQPSGPYSEINSAHRAFTIQNNVGMLEALLNCCHDWELKPKFIVTTTTGIPGAPDEPIIEGYVPNAAGSEYHMTRGWDSDNLRLAVKQWKLNVLELRTSIVYGTRIDGCDFPMTRLDWDFWFGTFIHRACLMAKMNKSVKIYGKGLQKKPFISLRDTVQSIINAIEYPVEGHVIMNQTIGALQIAETAKKIGKVEHIPNPRIENEEHQMIIHNEKFMKLLGREPSNFDEDIAWIKNDIDLTLLPENWEVAYNGKK